MKRILTALFATFGLFVLLFTSASANAQIDHCTPTPGTAVSTAPSEVRCWFTEALDGQKSTLIVMDSNGTRVDSGEGHVDPNDPTHQQMFATLKTLASGVYKVTWHAVTPSDNGVTDGTWYFGVGQVTVPTYAAPTTAASGAGATSTPAETTAPTVPAVLTAPSPASPTSGATAAATASPQATSAATVPAELIAPSPVSPTAAVTATSPVGTPAATPTAPAAPANASPVPLVLVAGALEAIVIIGILFYLYRRA